MVKALQPGDELDHGKYRLIRTLGQGGMGSVFEAEHTTSHKRVAVKCLHPDRARSLQGSQRMVLEARAAARVEHPNAVVIYDVCWDDGAVFLVMEYLKGETFKEALARRAFAPHEIVALLLPGMRAVAAAHKSGVIHRDITPANIFLAEVPDTRGPVTKILDFGVSKIIQQAEPSLTLAEAAVGTPLYMSYEQLAAEADVDPRADVYAFGVVLYEALTGQLPYTANSVAELAGKILDGPPLAPKELRSELPSTLSNLVLWALSKEREQRIASMDELICELEPFSTLRGFQAEVVDSMSLSSSGEHAPVAPPARARQADSGSMPLPKSPTTRQVGAPVRTLWLWLGVAAALVMGGASVYEVRRDAPDDAMKWHPAEVQRAQATEGAHAAEPAAALPGQVTSDSQPAAAAEKLAPLSAPAESSAEKRDAAPVAAPATAQAAAKAKRSPSRSRPEPAAAIAPPSEAVTQARQRRAADIARLREQLVQCGDLQTDWLRAQCKERTRHELAEREEDYELADPSARP